MQVVITQDDDRRITECAYEFDHREGLRTAVDEVAGEPEAVSAGIEIDPIQEGDEFVETPLYVADRISCHSTSAEFYLLIFPTGGRSAAIDASKPSLFSATARRQPGVVVTVVSIENVLTAQLL